MISGTSPGSITIIGTSHVSIESADIVERTIEQKQPDIVAVELDQIRYKQLCGDQPKEIVPTHFLRNKAIFQFMAYWLLSIVQAKIAKHFGVIPGVDMKSAIDTANANNIEIALVDRDIQITVNRFWNNLSFTQKIKLIWELLSTISIFNSPFDSEETDFFDTENTDIVEAMLLEFRKFSPLGAQALIDERDAYIAHQLLILSSTGKSVVAVVGAGHISGIKTHLLNPKKIPSLESLLKIHHSRKFPFLKFIGYSISIAFILFFVLLLMAGVQNTFLLKLFVSWVLFNAIFASTLAKLAGAHWQSALVGGLVAWATSLNPLLAPGWFAGYIELRYISVSMSDLERLRELFSTNDTSVLYFMSQLYSVPLFKLILIVAMTNIGSLIASLLFPFIIIPLIAPDIGGISVLFDMLLIGIKNIFQIFFNSIPLSL